MTSSHRRKAGARPRLAPTRRERLALEQLEDRLEDIRVLRRAEPSTSRVLTWPCASASCRVGLGHWARPGRTADAASCDRCGAPAPSGWPHDAAACRADHPLQVAAPSPDPATPAPLTPAERLAARVDARLAA